MIALAFTVALFQPKTITVALFLSPDCPICQAYRPEINRLVTRYASAPIRFVAVFADQGISQASAASASKEFGIMNWVRDDSVHWAHKLDAKVTPEAFVLDGSGFVRYRGRIDDMYANIGMKRTVVRNHELRDAVDALLVGKKPKTQKTTAIGCFLSR